MQETQESWVQSTCREYPLSRKWLNTPVFLPGKLQGQRSLASVTPCLKKRQTWLSYWAHKHRLSSIQSLSQVQHFVTPWTTARQPSLSITNSWRVLKLMSIESVMPSNYLIRWCPFLLPPSIFPSIRVFSNESVLHITWPKYWSFSFNISAFNEYSGLISFRMTWLDLLSVQGTLKSLLQHHGSKASILWWSAFFILQFSHPYMTTEKTIPLTWQNFVTKQCLCFLIFCLDWS